MWTGKKAQAANRKGLVISIDKNRELDLKSFLEGYILDGEDLGRLIYVFDSIGDDMIKGASYIHRYNQLGDILKKNKIPGEPIRLAYTAWSTEEKRKLLKTLQDNKAEGIVFKDIRAPYTPGRPASGGTQVKFKFKASASCVVTGINKKKRSVSIGLFEKAGLNSKLIEVGNVTIYPNFEIPDVRDIIEVEYLYAHLGGSIYQPVYKGKRTDIDLPACTMSQLKYKKEECE